MTQTENARIATVKIGQLELEGLMLPDSSFAIAVPQIASLFGTPKNYTSQQLKRLLGNEFRPHKIKTELGNQKINVVALQDFEKVLVALDRSGNIKAQELRDSLVGLSLAQLWADAFGVKFEKEERQKWLKFRGVNKKQYHPLLTSWLKKDGFIQGWEYGKAVNDFKSQLKLPLSSVDGYSSEQLEVMNRGEIRYDMARKMGAKHDDAIALIH